MAMVEVKVPDIGDFDEVAVIELLVNPGDSVKPEQSLITVESDKASMEIPSSHAGVVRQVKVALGDKVKQGSVVLLLEAADNGDAPAAEQGAVAAPPTSELAPAPTAASTPPASEPTSAPSSGGVVEVHVPDIGDFTDVAVIELLAHPGDAIKAEQSLITVESDKAAMEIPSSAAGILKELKVKVGDKVNKGDLLAILEASGGTAQAPSPAAKTQAPAAATPAPVASSQPTAAPATTTRAAPSAPAHDPSAMMKPGLAHASPSVRKFARELGVPLDELAGSGPKGRITQEDVQGFTRSVMSGAAQTKASAAKAPANAGGGGGSGLDLLPWPKVDFNRFGETERKDLSRIKKISGANLHRNWS